MKINLLFIFSLLSVGCANPKIKTNDGVESVSVLCQLHEPYCGGAYPGPGMENGQTLPLQNHAFLLKHGNSNNPHQPVIQTVQTDANGSIKLSLPVGTYSLIHTDKALPFEDFLAIHQRGKTTHFFHDQDTNCFAQWYQSADFSFEVKTGQPNDFHFTRYTNCFSGSNPCSHYVGPLPP